MNSDPTRTDFPADRVPSGIDVTTPSVARIYDYLLGGKDNYAPDREAAQRLLVALPEAGQIAQANRVFLQRAVRLCADAGITQFIDVGTGIPTAPAVHNVAQEINPEARVVYVDNDPVALAHARALLEDAGNSDKITVIDADMRHPSSILNHPNVNAAIDWDRPVAVLMLLMLHFVTDEEDPDGIVAAFRNAATPGSYIAVTHASGDMDREEVARYEAIYSNASSRMTLRTGQRLRGLLDGLQLLEPGLVYLRDWRPDLPPKTPSGLPQRNILYAAVGEVTQSEGGLIV